MTRRLLVIALSVLAACSTTHQDLGRDRGDGGVFGAQIVQLAAGRAHTCGLDERGDVWCWGDDTYGQLGVDGRDLGACQGLPCTGTPVHALALSGVRAIAAGGDQTCALLLDGRVRCFGSNTLGQLGRGASDAEAHATPYTVEVETVAAIAVGRFHACAVRDAGTVACWGLGDRDQLGVDAASLDTCVASDAVASAIGVAAGSAVSCATTPIEVPGVDDAVAIAAGAFHTCAVRRDGGMRCWGRGVEGQLGHGATPERVVPVEVVGIDNARVVAAGETHACAKDEDASVSCWGAHDVGQLGSGASPDAACGSTWVPCSAIAINVAIPDVSVETIALGDRHACALGTAGELFCWGDAARGALGVGVVTSCASAGGSCVASPAHIEGTFVAVATGGAHTCAARESGAVSCWGANDRGQAGGAIARDVSTPRDL